MIKIAFFEDHPLVQQSLRMIIGQQDDFALVFGVRSKELLISHLQVQTDIDVIIVDLISNGVIGLEVYEYIAKYYPEIKIIAFTSISSPVLVENLIGMGVKGYVNKNQDTEDLICAINKVYNNEIYLPQDYAFLERKNSFTVSLLTAREVEIMKLIIYEFTTADIAERLGLSVKTVENHRKSIFYKLDVKNVAGMVREAYKLGFVD